MCVSGRFRVRIAVGLPFQPLAGNITYSTCSMSRGTSKPRKSTHQITAHDSSRVLNWQTHGRNVSLRYFEFGLQYPFQPLAVNLTPLTFFFFLQFLPQDGLLVSIYSFNFTWCYTIRWRQTAFFFESIIIQSIHSTTLIDTMKVIELIIQPICSNNLNTVPLGEARAWFRTVTVLFVWITKRHDRHPIKLLSFCMWKNK